MLVVMELIRWLPPCQIERLDKILGFVLVMMLDLVGEYQVLGL